MVSGAGVCATHALAVNRKRDTQRLARKVALRARGYASGELD
jgi:hypothetical protein